jgi:hypothetical protein
MNNRTMVTGKSVVLAGKVRGWLYSTVLSDGTVYRRFVPKWNNTTTKEMDNMRIDRTTGQTYLTPKKTPAIKKVEEVIEIPAFMRERSKRMQEERAKREKKQKRRGSIFDLRV